MSQPIFSISEVSPPNSPRVPDNLTCQMPGCQRPTEVVTLDLRDWTADSECMPCHLMRYMAIISQMAANGDLPPLDTPPT